MMIKKYEGGRLSEGTNYAGLQDSLKEYETECNVWLCVLEHSYSLGAKQNASRFLKQERGEKGWKHRSNLENVWRCMIFDQTEVLRR